MTLDQAIAENQGKANALNFGSGKVVMIDQEADIGRAVEFIRGLRRKNMLYWDEVVSRNVIDLEGTWTYLLKGTDSRKKLFEHHGTCRAVIENRQAYFLGMRLQTTGEDGTLRKIIPPAPWQSSPIEFGDDGSMEFKSIISIDGTEVRGIARMQFVMPEKKRLIGGINYIVDPGQAVYAEVVFDRQAIEVSA